jgi:hypothetical protein
VQAVLLDKDRTVLPDLGTVVSIAEWPASFPEQWTEENTVIVRWDDDQGRMRYTPYALDVAARVLRVLESVAPCGHADAHHAVAGLPELWGCDECGATWTDDDGTKAESLAEVETPRFPDVMPHGRAPEPRRARRLMSVMAS